MNHFKGKTVLRGIAKKDENGKIKTDDNGNVIADALVIGKNSLDEPWAHTSVVNERFETQKNGILRKNSVSAIVSGPAEDLEEMFGGLSIGARVPGTVVVEESFNPFYEGQEPKVYPDNHPDAGDFVLKDGNPVFRNTRWTSNTNEETYVWIDNPMSEETEAQASEKEAAQEV